MLNRSGDRLLLRLVFVKVYQWSREDFLILPQSLDESDLGGSSLLSCSYLIPTLFVIRSYIVRMLFVYRSLSYTKKQRLVYEVLTNYLILH